MERTKENDFSSISGWKRLGKYDLLAPLGEGGMARVYLARQVGLADFQKVVVVKTIHPHLARQPEFVNMFLDEARIAAQINHPNVVQIYDLGQDHDAYYMVMEYLSGEPLSSVVSNSVAAGSHSLTPRLAARIVADGAAGLHAAHNLCSLDGAPLDVVHRDVSHGNLVVLYDGSTKVVDFGVAKAEGRLTQTTGKEVKGKYAYMSPEQITDGDLDRRSDVFALGVVLWESLTYKRLFRGGSSAATLNKILHARRTAPSSVRKGIPRELDKIALKALAIAPKDRFQSAGEMRDALLNCKAASTDEVGEMMRGIFARRYQARGRLLQALASAENPIELEKAGDLTAVLAQVDSGSLSLPGYSLPDHFKESASVGTLDGARAWPLKWIGLGLALPLVVLMVLWFATSKSEPAEVVVADDAATDAIATAAPLPDLDDPMPFPTDGMEAGADGAEGDEPEAGAETAAGDTVANDDAAKPTVKRTSKRGKRGRRASPRPPADSAKAKEHYDAAIRAFVGGRLGEAEKKMKASLAANGKYAPAHRGLGLVYERQGKKSAAIKELRRYLQLAPWASDADAIRKRLANLGG